MLRKPVTVLTYGTFDLFHLGHLNILKRASQLGDVLIAGISTDEFNMEKKKNAIYSYEARYQLVEACRYVNIVIPEYSWDQKEEDILRYKVDFLVMGDDWSGKFDHFESFCNVIYLPRTNSVSSTAIKRRVVNKHHQEISIK